MREELFRSVDSPSNDVNSVIDKYDNTIDLYLDYDVYNFLYPILSPNAIDFDNDFFSSNSISVREGFTSDEYKTISYLAQWEKEKIKYNPKRIVNYFNLLGYPVRSEDVFTLVIPQEASNFEKADCDILARKAEVGSPLDEVLAFEDYREQLRELEKYKNVIFARVGVNWSDPIEIGVSLGSTATIATWADGFDGFKLEGNLK